ncbi:MAG TPA: hypothetical protein VF273_06150 [Pelobium sp.]
MTKLIIFLWMLGSFAAFSKTTQNIAYFTVKENLLKGQKLAIIATDSLNNPDESINGIFNFSVNGFKQQLKFNNGVAVCPLELEKSTFIFIKHDNDVQNPSNLYFVLKKGTDLNPIKVNWYLLLILPIGLILIGYMFRRLVGLIIFVLSLLFYFYYSKGLSVPTFFESIFDGLKGLF